MRYIVERYKDSAKNTRYEEEAEGNDVVRILRCEAEWCTECGVGHRRYVIVRDSNSKETVITVDRKC